LDLGPVIVGPGPWDPNGYYPLPFELISKDKATGTIDLLIHVTNVPALGYRVIWIGGLSNEPSDSDRSDTKITSSGTGLSISNKTLTLKVDKTSGCVTSLIDNKSNAETIAPNACGNQLQFLKTLPRNSMHGILTQGRWMLLQRDRQS